jgi:hypothetical protein
MNRIAVLFCLSLSLAAAAFAQVVPDEALTAIQDNSFLLEEAYNQDPGVIQHISVLTRDVDTHAWAFTFTEEFAAKGLKHQLSYTLPILKEGASTGIGDIVLNYRYQLVGSAETNLAISPRLSLILPTQDDDFGDSSTGVQVALPISRIIAPRLATHTNLGATWFSDGGGTELSAGQSLVYAPSTRYQLMLEGVYTHSDGENGVVVSPGIRWGFNLKNGVQMVPGLAVPIGFADDDSKAVLFYLSFEK